MPNHKLFKADIFLVFITIAGLFYLYYSNKISVYYAIAIFAIYLLSKIIGYLILPYNKFEIFLNFLIDTSKVGKFSGFEIFKTTLVVLLYFGFLFLNPTIWIIESTLVIMMRVWGVYFIKRNSNI